MTVLCGRTLDPKRRRLSPTRPRRMTAKLAEIDAEHAKALAGGGAKYVERHHDRGKLTAARAHRTAASTRTRRSWS